MKKTMLMGWMAAIAASFLFIVAAAHSQPLDLFGKIELSGGVEKEAHASAGGRGTIEALGVLPLLPNFGVQGALHYVGGLGSRVGFNAGPVFGWDGGKVGAFVTYQHRGLRGTDFVHVIPSIAFYIPQMNFNLWYAHPVNGRQEGGHRVEYGVNKVQGTMSFFNGSDWGSWFRRDNVELVLGVQANTFAGAGHQKLGGTGVGPVIGASFLPLPGFVVNLVRGTFDDEGRYRVASGIEFFFGRRAVTLKEQRRKYLEPNQDLPPVGGEVKQHHRRAVCTIC